MRGKTVYRRQQTEKREGGQSMLEFALSLPLLLILLVAMVVVAWVGFCYMSITSAAREGTHWMTMNRNATDAEINAVVTAAMPLLDIAATTIVISPTNPDDRDGSGTQVSVHINYTVGLPTVRIPYVLVPGELTLSQPLQLAAESRMRLE